MLALGLVVETCLLAFPGTSADTPAGCSNDPGQHNTMMLLISGIHAAEDGNRRPRPSYEGMEGMISVHPLSCTGSQSTGRFEREKRAISQRSGLSVILSALKKSRHTKQLTRHSS